MVDINTANDYLNNRLFGKDNWINADDTKKQSALAMAEDLIAVEFGNTHENYQKAVFEQALYLLDNENNERFKLQMQNVKSVKLDDISENFGDNDILISPYARKLLQNNKKLSRVVDIT